MKNTVIKGLLGASLLTWQLASPAADLDLYANPVVTTKADLPNVLFVIDNTANWNTAFTNEMKALAKIMHDLPQDQFNVGFMLAAETGNPNNNVGGGYVRAAMRTMTKDNKALYEAMIKSFDQTADKGNKGASSLQMAEAYFYFTGGAVYAGNEKAKTDYTGNVYGSTASKAIYALTGNAIGAFKGATYNSPVTPGGCAKNYIIYISNGANQSAASDDTAAADMLDKTAGGGTIGTPSGLAARATMVISPSGSQSNPMDEWARYMKKSPLGITTYAIDIDPISTGQGPGWTALLKSTAGDNYVRVESDANGDKIVLALNEIFSKIQSVNSVFAAVSLPASANVQGAYLNQLYVGMFRPDAGSLPRWLGNLKQYKMGSANNLVDQDGTDAINTETGFVAECARSYWTPARPTADALDDYWANDPKGACIPAGSLPNLYANSNSPDGNIVEKGAQAYRMRGMTPSSRVVKTCSPTWASCTGMVAFDSTTVTSTALGAATAIERDALIRFAKGQNVDSELGKPTTEMRPSAHGDVIHSNPLALSYATDVIVYYGSNDGMLHAINGNRTTSYNGVLPGAELWAFMPPEFFPNIKRLRANTSLVSVSPLAGATRTGEAKPYGIDGPISTYREGSATYIYATMRRGGRVVYAFDVSDPLLPTLKWRTGCASSPGTDCTTGATSIGQTWSTPRPTKATGYLAGATPVLIMGGGYDDCEDADTNSCTGSAKGQNILVLDSLTGAVLKSLPTDRGVVGDVKIVPDADGYAKYGYAADLGGNIYRITIGADAPADWTILKIASLGCATTASCTDNRKFMFAPSVIPETDGSYSLYLGSGDREKPLNAAFFPHTTAVANYFFKVKDNPTDATWLSSERTNCQSKSVICLASLSSAGSTNTATCGASVAPTGKGWALGLRPSEQVVTLAATRFGVTTFSTHMPDVPVPGSCGAKLGTVHVYNLDITTAAPVTGSSCSDEVKGGGLPPPPEKMDVCTNASCSIVKSICIGCSTSSPIQSKELPVNTSTLGTNAKRRVYWYIQK